MVIIVFSENSINFTKPCIDSIKLYGTGCPIVLVDNHSEDGLNEWASMQENITYVYMDEGYQPIGTVLNQVIGELGIHDDLLIVDSHSIFTSGTLHGLVQVFINNPNAGIAVSKCNTQLNYQHLDPIETYDEAEMLCKERLSSNTTPYKQILYAGGGCALIRLEAWDSVGGFSNNFEVFANCMQDFSLSMLEHGFRSYVSNTSIVWDPRVDYISTPHLNEDAKLEAKWGVHYMNGSANANMISYIDSPKDEPIRVLEIGCDCGSTLLEIKNLYPNAKIYGSELNPNSAAIAAFFCDEVRINNVEDYNLDFGENNFDYILFGDVLEHLRNPEGTLLFVKSLLSANGKVIISVPNLMNIAVMKQLINGDFTYEESGLLDKTHIHFFTENELIKMVARAGYDLEMIGHVHYPISDENQKLIDTLLALSDKTKRHMYEAFQYIARISPQ